ncbi:CRNN protein, partial [Podargus strigoides]|nr:CRNN protein [Podargus strigoides]
MAQLQGNINGIIAAFYVCTRSDGDCSPLSREELRQLMEQEFADAMENPQDLKAAKKVLCFLDDDINCRVDFSELLSLVFRMAKACYKPLQQHQALEDDQELRAQEKAGGEQPSEPRRVGRVSCNQQVPERSLHNEDEDPETQDPDNSQIQEGETPEQDQDTHQDDGSEASEGDPQRDEILDAATPEQDRKTHKDEEIETPKQDPKTHQAKETEAPGMGSNDHLSPEMESAEQDLYCPSETQGRDPNKTQVCEVPQQDPNPGKIQELQPPRRSASPRRDPKPWETRPDPAFHQLPEPKVLEQEHSRTEAPSCPAQQQQDAHHQRQPAMEQQLLQSLYQWPPQQ